VIVPFALIGALTHVGAAVFYFEVSQACKGFLDFFCGLPAAAWAGLGNLLAAAACIAVVATRAWTRRRAAAMLGITAAGLLAFLAGNFLFAAFTDAPIRSGHFWVAAPLVILIIVLGAARESLPLTTAKHPAAD
jgi:hypothetical protein